MKKETAYWAVVSLMLLSGLGLMLYPSVSDHMRQQKMKSAIDMYRERTKAMEQQVSDSMLKEAEAYNLRLRERSDVPGTGSRGERMIYESLLDITGTGIMGYVEVPGEDILLPIYHGTDEKVLQSGAGHLEGSSLPIGGEGTHAVLTGHRGLASARLFSRLDRMKKGDIFIVRVLDRELTYKVDRILTVDPDELDALKIQEGEDFCTLVTCTPYGVNTRRLLVRGRRVEIPEDVRQEEIVCPRDQWWMLILPAVLAAGILLKKVYAGNRR